LKSINNIINIVFNGTIPTQALVDTGAGSSCVDEQYVIQNNMQISRLSSTDDHPFTIVDKSTLKVFGKANNNFYNWTGNISKSFHVISNLSVDIILGDDFLELNDAIIQRRQNIQFT